MIPVIDLHTDLINSYLRFGNRLLEKQVKSQISFTALKESGVKLFFAGFSYDDEYKNTKKQLEIYRKLFKKERVNLALTNKELRDFSKTSNAVLHLEGGGMIKRESDFYDFYSSGIRSIGLVHSGKNSLGCSTNSGNCGLTALGKRVVKLAEKEKVLIDLAHINEAGFYDVQSIASGPLFVSHAGCRTICDLPRNLSDDQIKTVAESGGVVGVFFSKRFVSVNPAAEIKDVIKHFIHIADLVGADYVAIGSDFGGISTGTPVGLECINKLQNLLVELGKVGFSKAEVEKIAYKNAMRVLSKSLL